MSLRLGDWRMNLNGVEGLLRLKGVDANGVVGAMTLMQLLTHRFGLSSRKSSDKRRLNFEHRKIE
jgi:hypothetical protein